MAGSFPVSSAVGQPRPLRLPPGGSIGDFLPVGAVTRNERGICVAHPRQASPSLPWGDTIRHFFTDTLATRQPSAPRDARLTPMTRDDRLQALTERWRARHDARRPSPERRQSAPSEREALAKRAFPYRSTPPAEYVEAHGADMTAFTYDDERYADPDLDAWILEVGRLLRERSGR